ncbi:CopD family protein [soil metagenome]
MKTGLRLMVAVGMVPALLATPGLALAQGHSSGHGGVQWLLTATGIAHGLTQGAAVFLAGLAAFAVLVWLPESRPSTVGSLRPLVLGAWSLFGLLLVAGTVDLVLYAVRASGQSFSLGLLGEALFETRMGRIWFARTVLGLIATLLVARAARDGRAAYWWGAVAAGGAVLATLSLQSHAAAEGGLLPLFSNWLHVVAGSVWMGGLLGFPLLLLGPLREPEAGPRAELLSKVVRRFSRVATVAVVVILVTGVHAMLLNVPDAATLVSTAYGRALVMKLGLFALLLAAGGINLIDCGKGPFGRMVGAELVLAFGIFLAAGFLTILPPTG